MLRPFPILTSALAVCSAIVIFALPSISLSQDKMENFSVDFIGNYPDQGVGFARISQVANSAAAKKLIESGRIYRRSADSIQNYYLEKTGVGTDQIEYQINCSNAEAGFEYTIIRTCEDNLENFKSLGKVEPGENKAAFPIKMTQESRSSKYCLIVDERTIIFSSNSNSLDFAMSIPRSAARQANWYSDFQKVASRDVVGVIGESGLKLLIDEDPLRLGKFFSPEQMELLSKATTVVASANIDQKINARVTIRFPSVADAKAMQSQIESMKTAWSLALEVASKSSRVASKVIAMTAEEALKSLKAKVSGTRLQLDTTFGLAAFSEEAIKLDEAALRTTGMNNTRQLTLALLNYDSAYGHFPPAVVRHESGQVHSWRVAILPFLGESDLQREYRFDEPWNSTHNAKVTRDMPSCFKHPSNDSETNTNYFVVVGRDAVFAPDKLTMFSDIMDGTSNTIMILEAKRDCHWAKPEDIPFAEAVAKKSLGGFSEGLITATMCDGSVHMLSDTLTSEQMSALLTIDGGEVVDDVFK